MSCLNVPLFVPQFGIPFKAESKKREIPQVSGIWESGTLIGHPFYRFPLKIPHCESRTVRNPKKRDMRE